MLSLATKIKMSAGDWKDMFKGVQQNDLELVKYHLRSGIDPNYQHPEFMALPLSESIRHNHTDMVKLLQDHGANPMTREIESALTPMALAKKLNNKIELDLMNKQADI